MNRLTPVRTGQLKETERVRPEGLGRQAMIAQRAIRFLPSARRLLRQVAPDRTKVGGVFLLALVSVGLAAVAPRILGRATDLVFSGVFGRQFPVGLSRAEAAESLRSGGESTVADMVAAMEHLVPGQGVDFQAVWLVLLLTLAVYTVSGLLGWLQGYLLNDVVVATVRRLRDEVEAKIHRVPLDYFDRQPRGELLSRVTNDIDNVAQSLSQAMSQVLSSLLTVLGVVVMMVLLSPSLALVALVTVPTSLALTALIMRRSQKLFVEQWRRTGALTTRIEEAFTGHDLITVFGRRRDVNAAFGRENMELFTAGFGAQFISGLIMPMMFFIGSLTYLVIAVIGGLRVAAGTMSLGGVQAFISYTQQLTHPLSQLASMVNLLQSGVASAERVFELLDADEEPEESTGALPAPVRLGRVVLDQVAFRYDPETPLIENLSLVAEPGETVAIVGPTGAGKTTLVNLIMRFYDVDSGRITLDGVDIVSMRRAELRGQVGMVLQDTWLFEGTIRDNIAYGRPEASEKEVLAAAQAAFVDRFVHHLPEQYNTLVAESESNLSVGERQLITIARAFLADPALLILDEATSSVDTRTEVLLQNAMRGLRSDRTSFVIAHRLSTIRDADLILMMDQGRIVEQGSHGALLQADGAYAKLYNTQFTAPVIA